MLKFKFFPKTNPLARVYPLQTTIDGQTDRQTDGRTADDDRTKSSTVT